MAEQIKYGRYLHGGDYNPEQCLFVSIFGIYSPKT